jgi:hypothetical protein
MAPFTVHDLVDDSPRHRIQALARRMQEKKESDESPVVLTLTLSHATSNRVEPNRTLKKSKKR